MVCSATTTMLPASATASQASAPPRSAHSCSGRMPPSQSTTRPSTANSSASKADMAAVRKASQKTLPRRPSVQAHRKAKKPWGGSAGSAGG